MNQSSRPKPVALPNPIDQIVLTHLINAVQFGSVTIRYQHGRPFQIERLEVTRLTNPEEPE